MRGRQPRRSILHAGEGTNWRARTCLHIGRRHDETLPDVSVDDLRVYDRQLTASRWRRSGGADAARATCSRSRRPAQRRAARPASTTSPPRAPLAAARGARGRARRGERAAHVAREVMVMQELPQPRPTFVLARGAYDAPDRPGRARHAGARPPVRRTLPQQPARPRALAARPATPAHRARRRESLLGDGLRPRPRRAPARTSASRASCRRTRSCSTGSRDVRRVAAGT